MATFRMAFYKGTRPGIPGIYNRLVRRRGRGKYSHVEIRFSDGLSASSSFEDGGVRFKPIAYNPAHWDFIDLPLAWEPFARAWFEAHEGERYDLRGNVHLTIGFIPHSSNRQFCSEACAAALGIAEPWRFEPNAIHAVVRRMTDIYGARAA